jgi:hypothetical protein
VLTAVLDQSVHGAGMPVNQGLEGSARADRGQLAVIANKHLSAFK